MNKEQFPINWCFCLAFSSDFHNFYVYKFSKFTEPKIFMSITGFWGCTNSTKALWLFDDRVTIKLYIQLCDTIVWHFCKNSDTLAWTISLFKNLQLGSPLRALTKVNYPVNDHTFPSSFNMKKESINLEISSFSFLLFFGLSNILMSCLLWM